MAATEEALEYLGEKDTEWVADLIETFRAGDLDVALAEVDALCRTLRRAVNARRALTTISPSLLKRGLEVRAGRQCSTR